MNWMTNLWFNYFWPSLKGNGPEALVQTVAYAVGGFLLSYVFIPQVRKFVNGHVKSFHDKLDAQHLARMNQAERHHAEAMKKADDHHDAHMKALGARKVPATKKAAAKKAPAKRRAT